jgi:hypothetical protein
MSDLEVLFSLLENLYRTRYERTESAILAELLKIPSFLRRFLLFLHIPFPVSDSRPPDMVPQT